MRRSRDIRAQAEACEIGRKSRRRGRSQEDDHSLTFDPNEFGVREPNSAEIRCAVLRNALTDRHTGIQTPLLYIYRYIVYVHAVYTCTLNIQTTQTDKQTDHATDINSHTNMNIQDYTYIHTIHRRRKQLSTGGAPSLAVLCGRYQLPVAFVLEDIRKTPRSSRLINRCSSYYVQNRHVKKWGGTCPRAPVLPTPMQYSH